MKIILPFERNPPFKTYTFWANYLGIWIGSNKPVRGFLLHHFMILPHFMFFSRVGYTAGYKLRKKFSKIRVDAENPDLVNVLRSGLQQGWYAILVLDRSKVLGFQEPCASYRDWVIHGFDDDAQVFYGVGYVWDKNYLATSYSQILISYETLMQAVPPKGCKYKDKGKYLDHQFLRMENNQMFESPSLRVIRRNCFLVAHHLVYPWNQDRVYRIFYKYNNMRKSKLGAPFDLRPLKTILENKKLLLELINGYFPDSELACQYKEIYAIGNAMLLTATKYNIKEKFSLEHRRNLTLRIDQLFLTLCQKEPTVLRQLYWDLKTIV